MLGCSKSERRYKIGVSQCSEDDWRSNLNDEIEREMMFHNEIDVEIRSSQGQSLPSGLLNLQRKKQEL